MVFIIQKSQNKDSLAIQLKLNELVASAKGASNRLIDVECLSEDDLKLLRTYYEKLNKLATKSKNLQETHSIEEAEELNDNKLEGSNN
jgi:low affinity Fe/Cu permease